MARTVGEPASPIWADTVSPTLIAATAMAAPAASATYPATTRVSG
jgi:hypothetical protein